MKGITHFISGVAAASFFREAVVMGASSRTGLPDASSSFILALAGVFAILPDTLDFKLGQFLSMAEHEIPCDAVHPDPQAMAEGLGQAIDEAHETGRYIRAQLFPMKLGADMWRQYVLKFDGEKNEVVVVINEVVTMSQVPYPGTAPEENRVGRYKCKANLLETHGRPNVVDILSGPQYGFRKVGDQVAVEFLPWHRTWSHSYVFGAILALPVMLIAYLLNFAHWPIYGLVCFLAFATHISEDLTGHLGGSLLWPLYGKRFDGFCWFKASNPTVNFTVIWTAIVLLLWNIDRFTTQLVTMPAPIFFLAFIVFPLAIYLGLCWRYGEPPRPKDEGAERAEAVLLEEEAKRAEEERSVVAAAPTSALSERIRWANEEMSADDESI